MDRNQQLNMLAAAYRRSQDQKAFEELVRLFRPEWERRKRADAKRAMTDVATIESMYLEVLWRCASTYEDTGDFANMVSRAIKRRRIDLLRANKTIQRRIKYASIDGDDSDAPTFEIAEEFDPQYSSSTEEIVIKKMTTKKEKDKVSLVSHLIESAKTLNDEATMKIIEQFPQYDRPSTLAKALGMHHETVKRKLLRLSRFYDANRFGDIREYLAV
jgi:DNA-directed RNA polymerase specialized sigma24 family protein